MRTLRGFLATVVWLLPLTSNTALLAQESAPVPLPHVRPLSADARELVETGSARSALIGAMLDRLEASDLVVYVDVRWFPDARTGKLVFIGGAGGVRYVVIHIACGHIVLDQVAALGHELRHAVEVADATAVVDRDSFGRHYARIGIDVGGDGPNRQFETVAAVEAGRHVKRELAWIATSGGDR